MKFSSNALLIFAVLLILTLLVVGQYSEYSNRVDFKMMTAGFYITPTVNYTINMSVSYNGSAVAKGSSVCRGTVLNITPIYTSTFTISDRLDADVRCPTAACEIDKSVVGPATGNVKWVNSTYYNGLRASLGLDPNSWCNGDVGLPQPWPLTAIDAKYYLKKNPDNPSSGFDGRALVGVYCHGTADVLYDGAVVQGGSQDLSKTVTEVQYTPQESGLHSLSANINISNCSMFVHGYEIIDNDVYQCIYPNNGSLTTKVVAGEQFYLNIVPAPDLLNLSASLPENAQTDDVVSWSITIKNVGDGDANITDISISGLSNTVVTTPALPYILQAGSSVTISGSGNVPSSEGDYSVTAGVTYIGIMSGPVIGTCDELATETFGIGNITVRKIPPVPPPPVDITMSVYPSFVVRTTGDKYYKGSTQIYDVNVTGEVTRDWDYGKNRVGSIEVNMTVKKFNITNGQWDKIYYYIFAPDIKQPSQPSHYCSKWASGCNEYSDKLLEIDSPQEDKKLIKLRQPISHPVGAVGCTNIWPCSSDWENGLYSVTASVYDSLNKSTQTRTAYFVILGLDCMDYA